MFVKIISKISACILPIILFVPAFSQSRLPMPKGGMLRLDLPDGWSEERRITPKDLPPTIEFKKCNPAIGTLQITVMWSPKNDPTFGSHDSIKNAVELTKSQIVTSSVETQIPLTTISGMQGEGYYFEATDKSYKPGPGQFPIITSGVLGANNYMIIFTILSHNKSDSTVKEGLDCLSKSVLLSNNYFENYPESSSVHVLEKDNIFSIFVPASNLVLLFKKNDFICKPAESVGGPNNPKYFYFENKDASQIISGWFEPAELFKGVDIDWESNMKNWKGKPELEPFDIDRFEESNWKVIQYCTKHTSGSRVHIKAHLVQDGTWIDVHLSIAAKTGLQETKADAKKLLKSIFINSRAKSN